MNFSEKVYRIVSGIPPGRVMTYSGVASLAGSPRGSRAVGNLMARNPNPGTGPGKVPCHRVVRSDGTPGGFSGQGGPSRKRRLLESEGVRFENERIARDFLDDRLRPRG
jgi:O-6-methylguanine DNA methyltransferase